MSTAVLSLTPQSNPESTEWIAQIASSAKTMGQMVGDLIDFTRTRLGTGMPTSPAPMDLGSLSREVFDEFAAGHPAAEMYFRAEGVLTGDWDINRLRQAISNLLANAIQHGSESAPIRLSVISEGPHVLITVCNGGLAIPPGDLATIFDPLVPGPAVSASASILPARWSAPTAEPSA
jgi:signal transduction histidine kinase